MSGINQKINIDLADYLLNCRLPVYRKACESSKRFIVLMGGGGSGKSFVTSQEIIIRLVGIQEPLKVLVIRNVKEDNKHSTFTELKSRIADLGWQELFKINNSTMEITCKHNDNSIIFKGLDDIERVKSISGVSMIWIEEASQISEADFNQLDIRLRTPRESYPLQIWLTFNPISATHWLKKKFFDTKDERAYVLKTTYKDNRFLDPEAIKTLEGHKETSPYFYKVYCLGEWGTTGDTVFDRELIGRRIDEVFVKRFRRGYFAFDYEEQMIVDETIRFVDCPEGVVTIYEEPDDIMPYVIGADTAGTGIDFFAALAMNNYTGKIAAQLHGNGKEGALKASSKDSGAEKYFTDQLYCLGKWYNEGMLNVEVNYSTYPVLELARLQYPNLYIREVVDANDGSMTVNKYGFSTNKSTRNTILSLNDEYIRTQIQTIDSCELLDELSLFVLVETNTKGRKSSMRQEASQGAHDDLIMALGITLFTRNQWTKTPREDMRPRWKMDAFNPLGFFDDDDEDISIW